MTCNAKGNLRYRASNAKGDLWSRHLGDDLVGLERGFEQALEEIVGLDAPLVGDDGRAEPEAGRGIVGVRVVIGAGNAKGDLWSRAGNAKGGRWSRAGNAKGDRWSRASNAKGDAFGKWVDAADDWAMRSGRAYNDVGDAAQQMGRDTQEGFSNAGSAVKNYSENSLVQLERIRSQYDRYLWSRASNAKGDRASNAKGDLWSRAGNARGNLWNRARTATAAIALVTGGYLVISGTTAEPAAGEGSSEGSKGGFLGWLTQGWPASRVDPAEDKADAQDVDAYSKKNTASKKKTADNAADPATSRRSSVADKADLFLPGPQYDKKYDAKAQIDTYGAKVAVEPPRPLELGREQYTSGLYPESGTLLGELNPLLPGLSIYGDWRTAVAHNKNNGKEISQVATRLNIDVDFKLTSTERIHAFFTPLQNNNKFTRYEFGGPDGDKKFTAELDFNPQTLFFEGDVGSLYSGFSGTEANFDLPFTVGLFPLFLQNGIWANDAILGGAVSLTAKNSKKLGLANYDVTVFAAFDNVDNAGILGAGNRKANIAGVTTFIDAFGGYIEAGYGAIQATENQVINGVQLNQVDGQLTHFVAAAYTRRFANTLSNTTRVFANFGDGKNDDGVVVISENSLVSSLPSTLLPYANFFVGIGNPQPLVDGNNAGILKNVGINFETDALTGYPKLNDSGSNAWGGAIGIQYLFNLDQQIVFEVASVQPFGDPIAGIGAAKPQYGFGTRYQIALDRAWLFRADATYQILDGGDKDNFGVRSEIRRKF